MKRAAIIVNPVKNVDLKLLRHTVAEQSENAGWSEPLWFETTASSPGTEQARAAIEAGATAVLVGGGDGTVRAVAAVLAGTGIPMTLIPLGTGNLLARNLPLPARADLADRVAPAFSGTTTKIDVGWLRLHRPASEDKPEREAAEPASDPAQDHLMLVIAGLGFGAEIMAHTDDKLKRRVGWLAYFVAGARNWRGSRTRVRLSIDGQEPIRRRQRTVLVGNCGKIMGGLTLLPDAKIDDGWLDIAVIDPRGGIFGWTRLFGEVVRQGMRRRSSWPPDRTIQHERCRRMTVVSAPLQQVQIDGDVIGSAHGFSAWVEPKSLTIALPAT